MTYGVISMAAIKVYRIGSLNYTHAILVLFSIIKCTNNLLTTTYICVSINNEGFYTLFSLTKQHFLHHRKSTKIERKILT